MMKTLNEYIQKKQISNNTITADYGKIISKDNIKCILVGKSGNTNIYLSLPTINANKLETRGMSMWLPITGGITAIVDLNRPAGWHIPAYSIAENIILPYIQKLSPEELNSIFYNNMDFFKRKALFKLPVLEKNRNDLVYAIKINTQAPKQSSITKLRDNETDIFGCYIKMEVDE